MNRLLKISGCRNSSEKITNLIDLKNQKNQIYLYALMRQALLLRVRINVFQIFWISEFTEPLFKSSSVEGKLRKK